MCPALSSVGHFPLASKENPFLKYKIKNYENKNYHSISLHAYGKHAAHFKGNSATAKYSGSKSHATTNDESNYSW